MGIKRFDTLIRTGNEYIIGRISGIKFILCDGSASCALHGMYGADDGRIMVSECTQEQYDMFTNVVEKAYPNMCVFNYEG